MDAKKHPAYDEEQSHLLQTITDVEAEIDGGLKNSGIENLYAPPDTIRIFSNQAAKHIRDCKAALRDLYFGRVDWKAEGNTEAEQFYIGISSLHPHIIAWQDTLASDLYYNRDTSRERGELILVRTILISNRSIRELEDNFQDAAITGELSPDSMLSHILNESRGMLSEIVATINAQQNRIIRAPLSDSLVVQGVPGSGKTVIALHRVAYLLYNHKDLRTQNILILGPNPVFMNYVSKVLPSLGERQIPQKTFDSWVIDQLGEKLAYQSQEDLLEFWLSANKSTSEKVMHLRNCQNMGLLKMGELLSRYTDFLQQEVLKDKDVLVCTFMLPASSSRRIKEAKAERTQKQIENFLTEVSQTPLNLRREALVLKLANDITSEMIRTLGISSFDRDNYRKQIFDKVKEQVHSYFSNWRAQNVSVAYRRLFRQPGLLQMLGRGIFDRWDLQLMSIDAPTAQTPFRFSDLVGLLYFKLLLEGTSNESYGHIVVDEAQDIPVLFFDGLSRFTPKKSITVLGDIGQGIFPNNGLNSWQELFPIFPTLNREVQELRVCYRSTYEIMNYANAMLQRAGISESKFIKPLNRPGQAPTMHPCESDEERTQEILKAIRVEMDNGYHSIAIICKSAQECRHLAELFNSQGFKDFDLVDNREKAYQGGIVILPTYLAKGLEFDVSIVADSHNYGADDLSVKLLFVAITRPAHRLHVFWLGAPSPLLDTSLDEVQVESFLSDKNTPARTNLEAYAQANRLDPDWCVEVLARAGLLPLLTDGVIDPIVMDLLAQENRNINSNISEENLLVPLTPGHDQILNQQVRKLEGSLDGTVQDGLAFVQTTFGLLKNHMRNLGLLPEKDVEQSLVEQVVLLVRLRKLLQDAGLTLPAGRWAGLQRLADDVDQSRREQHKILLQTLLDYGILDNQTTTDEREQVRVNERWLLDLLNTGLGYSTEGFDTDLLSKLPQLPEPFSIFGTGDVENG